MCERDGQDLVACGAGREGLGRVRQNDDIVRAGTALENGAHLPRSGVDEADRVAAAVGDRERLAVGRDAHRCWLFAGADDCHFAARLEIDDRHIVRSRVGDVGKLVIRIKRHSDRLPVYWDGGGDASCSRR